MPLFLGMVLRIKLRWFGGRSKDEILYKNLQFNCLSPACRDIIPCYAQEGLPITIQGISLLQLNPYTRRINSLE
jgi:hypothetical protein